MNEAEEMMKKYKQCWRCGIYLPREELQQWKGMWYCPYCLNEIIEEEEMKEKLKDKARRNGWETTSEGPKVPEIKPPDDEGGATASRVRDGQFLCDKCGKTMDKIIILADHKFCEQCFREYEKQLKANGIAVPPHVILKKKTSGFLLSALLKSLKQRITALWRKKKEVKNASNSEHSRHAHSRHAREDRR